MNSLGKKHECSYCKAKFYDLGNKEIICPKCGSPLSENNYIEIVNKKTKRLKNTKLENTERKNDFLDQIGNLILNEELFEELYEFENYEFLDLKEFSSMKAGNPHNGGGGMIDCHKFLIVNKTDFTEYEVAIGFNSRWYKSNSRLLLVFINNRDAATLEYNMSKNIYLENTNNLKAEHSGSITVKTAIKAKHVINYISKSFNKLIIGNHIYLGSIKVNSEELVFNSIKEFISKLIIFSIIVDIFKKQWRDLPVGNNRIPIDQNLRNKILDRDGLRCKKCHSIFDLEIDHIRPYSWFVKENKTELANLENNLQVLCKKHNLEKSNKHATRY
jgi:5-methylcytosine-specific restriction endonuclease McrA